MGTRPGGVKWIIGLLLIIFVVTAIYWITFYTSGDVQVRQDEAYLAFERSFPLADAWMAICALLGAIGLWRSKAWGFLFGLLAASSAIFLGLMDVLFNLNEGLYIIVGTEMLIEVVINVFTLSMGPVIIWYLWKRREFLA